MECYTTSFYIESKSLFGIRTHFKKIGLFVRDDCVYFGFGIDKGLSWKGLSCDGKSIWNDDLVTRWINVRILYVRNGRAEKSFLEDARKDGYLNQYLDYWICDVVGRAAEDYDWYNIDGEKVNLDYWKDRFGNSVVSNGWEIMVN